MVPDPRVRILRPMTLDRPVLVAAWPGIGLVGYNAVEYLRTALETEPVAELEPFDNFSVQGIHVKEGISLPPRLPTNVFHACTSTRGPHLLLFIGSAQPVSGKEMAVANLVLEVARRYGAVQIYTAAAMVTQIDHVATPRVWGVATGPEAWERLANLGVQKVQEGAVGGLNGLLVGIAQLVRIPATCLMGEMPQYTAQIENPKATLAVLEVLASILDLRIDLQPLREKARFVEQQIQHVLDAARERSQASAAPSAQAKPAVTAPDEPEEEPDEREDKGSGRTIN